LVEDLILEALLDDARRRFAGPEAGDARLSRIVAREAVDFGVDDVLGDLDLDGFAGFVDVGEFGLHRESAKWRIGELVNSPIHQFKNSPTTECERGDSNPQSLSATGS